MSKPRPYCETCERHLSMQEQYGKRGHRHDKDVPTSRRAQARRPQRQASYAEGALGRLPMTERRK